MRQSSLSQFKGEDVEELRRKSVHIGMGLWMFYPLVLTRIPALLVVAIMLFLALFVFRLHAWRASFVAMAREEDYVYGYLIGPLIYICAIGVCVIFYPLFISAASIGVMAFGDGFATIVGKRWGRTRNPVDDNKTVEGSVAFFIFAFAALIFAMHFTAPLDTLRDVATLAAIGAIVGAIVEMIPFELHRGTSIYQRIFIDDNFFVPIVSGLVMALSYTLFF